jgi:hypothetical protein
MATLYILFDALHDALLKPLPGSTMALTLAEAWTESPDSKVYAFKLREQLGFRNGDPLTAEDVKCRNSGTLPPDRLHRTTTVRLRSAFRIPPVQPRAGQTSAGGRGLSQRI